MSMDSTNTTPEQREAVLHGLLDAGNREPGREAFEKWQIKDRRNRIPELQGWTDEQIIDLVQDSSDREWKIWQAAMAHKDAELEAIKAQYARIGLDIDRALKGQVNEKSPIAGRLRLIADHKEAGTWQPIETTPDQGEYLVWGGTWNAEISDEKPSTVAHIIRDGNEYCVCGTDYYGARIVNPKGWMPLPAAPLPQGE